MRRPRRSAPSYLSFALLPTWALFLVTVPPVRMPPALRAVLIVVVAVHLFLMFRTSLRVDSRGVRTKRFGWPVLRTVALTKIIGTRIVGGMDWTPRGHFGVALELHSGRMVQLQETTNRSAAGAAVWQQWVDAEIAVAWSGSEERLGPELR